MQILPYDGGVARFLTDPASAQQCFVTSEPLAARRQGVEPKVFLGADEGFNPYVGVVVTRASLWKDKPELVRAFVRASREGWKAYLQDPAPANATMAKLNPAMDARTFQEAAAAQKPLIDDGKTPLGSMSAERWKTLADTLVSLGLLSSPSLPTLPALD